ncbi:hypothetical protein BKA65DRAFT_69674 [Rhexocercosporidium sp. MPI-PUGE-AT-0058]|nr:hypothetical protein BKA65DRAFT_69674 [Rhexocercosporidium sp. MPI-PUGE-AT-0058]
MPSMYISRLDDIRSLQTKVEEKAHDLFKGKAGISPLQVTRIFHGRCANELAEKENAPRLVKDEDVWNSVQVKALRNDSGDATQIFTIHQDRSWTTLNIPLNVFEGFMETYKITPNFWKFMFAFGRKSEENEFEFPGFNRRKTIAGKPLAAVKYGKPLPTLQVKIFPYPNDRIFSTSSLPSLHCPIASLRPTHPDRHLDHRQPQETVTSLIPGSVYMIQSTSRYAYGPVFSRSAALASHLQSSFVGCRISVSLQS